MTEYIIQSMYMNQWCIRSGAWANTNTLSQQNWHVSNKCFTCKLKNIWYRDCQHHWIITGVEVGVGGVLKKHQASRWFVLCPDIKQYSLLSFVSVARPRGSLWGPLGLTLRWWRGSSFLLSSHRVQSHVWFTLLRFLRILHPETWEGRVIPSESPHRCSLWCHPAEVRIC